MNGLYTYALVSTLYNEKGDYIDCFLPFAISVIDSKYSNIQSEIQGRIKERYGLEIPGHSLKTILKRGRKKEYITEKNRQYSLTEKGIGLNDGNEHKNTRREINGFIKELEKHLNESGLKIEQTEKAFQQYVYSNLRSLFFFLDTETLKATDKQKSECGPIITEFILKIEKENSTLFKVFQNIVFGKVISLAISGWQDIGELQQTFSKTTLFLDTNVIFDILGLQGDDAQKVTNEFVRIARKSKKFNFKIFDFTVDEIIRVISNYTSQSKIYISNIKVDSVYCNLKAKGWKKTDVSHFIQNIDQTLKDNDIHIFETKKPNFTDTQEKVNKLAQHKPDKSQLSYEHDIRAIYEVAKIRSISIRKFERAKCFFLSQDFRLAVFNFNEYEHKKYHSVPEVMLEWSLTNLLWLKQPKDIPLNALISFHKKYAIVDKNVWDLFYEKILKAKEDDKEFYDDTTTLLCHHQLQIALSNLDSDASEEEVEEVVKKGAEIVRQKEKIERDNLLEKQRIKFESELSDQIKKVKDEKASELDKGRSKKIEALIKHRDKAINKAKKKSNRVWNIIRLVITLSLLSILIVLSSTIYSQWEKIEPIAWIASILISLLVGIWGLKFTGLKNKMDEYYKRKKLNDLHFEDLMNSLEVNQNDLNRAENKEVTREIKS